MTPAVALFCPDIASASRLNYILNWIFSEQLKLTYQVCENKETWKTSNGFKINYSKEQLEEADCWIKPQGLLSENKNISPKSLAVQRWKRITVLFYNQPGAPVPFDIFSAVFYLLSRYEEYLPFTPDKHGRFPSSASAAGQFHFLSEPVIDQWLFHFRQYLIAKGVPVQGKRFEWHITFDVDMAWQFKNKSRTEQLGGGLKDLLRFDFKNIQNRIRVLTGKREDPFYSFEDLQKLHCSNGIQPVYFFLLGDKSRYDRNTPGGHPGMQQLIKKLSDTNEIGLHPSYRSHQNIAFLKQEKELLETIIQKQVTKSRQHYIKFTLPETYENLLQSGIREDYSMGYASENGFRAGTSNAFFWYDLKRETTTDLFIHPFAFMDATSRYYLHHSPEAALQTWEKLFLQTQAVCGQFISIWHNYNLSTESEWFTIYHKAIDFAKSKTEAVSKSFPPIK